MKYSGKNHLKHNILILEDDSKLANLIIKALKEDYLYTINVTHSITEAQKLLEVKYFDLVCVDLILPDGRGENFCQKIRKNPKFLLTKIIVISQKNSIQDRIEILEQDIDDYLPKPFYPAELRVRIKKLLGLTNPKTYHSKINNLELNYYKKCLKVREQEISLTITEFLILKCIFENKGFADKDILLAFLSRQKNQNVSDTSLATTINRLQKKCKRQTGETYLKNKYGVGYYLH